MKFQLSHFLGILIGLIWGVGATGSSSCLYQETYSDSRVSTESEVDWRSLLFQISPAEKLATKLFLRLTGTAIPFNHPHFKKVVRLIEKGNRLEAARWVTREKNFLQIRLKNFASIFSSKEYSPLEPFNDLQALMIGITRDELDARLLMIGKFRYSGYDSLKLPAVSLENNGHFLRFESRGLDFESDLEQVSPQWKGTNYGGSTSGIFSTRAWAKANFDAGTNRASIKNTFELFLCTSIEKWKRRGVPDFFVRRDVDRNPANNPATYQNECRSCHSLMDPVAGAFAKFDFMDSTLQFYSSGVAPKMNQNGYVYPPGYVTIDDSWVNLFNYSGSNSFGWRSPLSGQGVEEFANMIANASSFSQCMVKRVYSEVCGGAIESIPQTFVTQMSEDFENNGYNLKYLFYKTASHNECIQE